ncbi:MAG: Nif3-like dinuclear metal center hexameric protein [Lactobacillales bacterium]|jgi:dinuclear metal center YbgI/SA1388 family protein|nr:Nif3-like dinuclear metal center hexameric protein [Lactobacillales bacterium]
MKVIDYYNKLNDLFPFELAESWDYSGLQIGDPQATVNNVLVTLDVTNAVVDEAINKNIDLIIAHHPPIFEDLKQITQPKLLKLIGNKIAVISAHTNFDRVAMGEAFAKKYELNSQKKDYLTIAEIDDEKLNKIIKDYPSKLINPKKSVKKIAIVLGSAAEFYEDAIAQGADAFITGDIKYHDALDIKDSDLFTIDIGHHAEHEFFTKIIKEKIGGEVSKVNTYPFEK